MVAWGAALAMLAGCGRVGFELLDGGVDGGPLQVECEGNEPCSRSCGAAECSASCASGSTCTVEGEGGPSLELACEGAATCAARTEDVDHVRASCAPASSCQVECEDADVCEVDCAEGASCELRCSDTAECRMRCAPGAACFVRCPAWWDGRCELEGCDEEVDCGRREVACGRECPS